jgi:hypothetical protein
MTKLVIKAGTWYWWLLYTDKTFTISIVAAWVSDTFVPRRTWVPPVQISHAHPYLKNALVREIIMCIWINVLNKSIVVDIVVLTIEHADCLSISKITFIGPPTDSRKTWKSLIISAKLIKHNLRSIRYTAIFPCVTWFLTIC